MNKAAWLAALAGRLQGDGASIPRHPIGACGAFELPPGARVERDIAYGTDPAQAIDVYRPAQADGAPLMLVVHGGAWSRGDKGLLRSVRNKVMHWVGRGCVLASVNYRMLPQAHPLEQADDVALALAFVQQHARAWGADGTQAVLIGHSAGAHLVSLIAADPRIGARFGVGPWRATISVDSAAFDLVPIMSGRHFGFYDQAFGADPAYWRDASPFHRLIAPPSAPWLAVCSSLRGDSCPQAHAFAAKAASLGGQVSVLEVALSHADLNDLLGAPGAYTDEVDAFLRALNLP
ncbi:MAG TPA: alpha/beta hydrolase [Burkholderiaceae bacterium]|nr:alpha/beta hydrolase [Burkholderiaceae bacterium]